MTAFLRDVRHHLDRATMRTGPPIRPVFEPGHFRGSPIGPNCPLESLTEGEAGMTG